MQEHGLMVLKTIQAMISCSNGLICEDHSCWFSSGKLHYMMVGSVTVKVPWQRWRVCWGWRRCSPTAVFPIWRRKNWEEIHNPNDSDARKVCQIFHYIWANLSSLKILKNESDRICWEILKYLPKLFSSVCFQITCPPYLPKPVARPCLAHTVLSLLLTDVDDAYWWPLRTSKDVGMFQHMIIVAFVCVSCPVLHL